MGGERGQFKRVRGWGWKTGLRFGTELGLREGWG